MTNSSGLDISLLQSSSDSTVLIPASEISSPDGLAIFADPGKCYTASKIYHQEFYRTKDRSQLDNAIFCAQKAVDVCAIENPLRMKCFFILGNYLASRYDRYTNVQGQTDLDASLDALQKSLRIDEDEEGGVDFVEYERVKALGSSAQCYKMRFLLTGSQDDLNGAIRACDEALMIYEELGLDEKIAETERLMAVIHEEGFKKMEGDTRRLNRAIQYARRAVDSYEALGMIDNESMETLARSYGRRYPVSLNEDDLYDAIVIWEELVVEEDSDQGRAPYLFELGRAYYSLTKVTESPADGSEASTNLRQAVQSTPRDDPALTERSNLSRECIDFLSESIGYDVRGKPTNADIKRKKGEIFIASRQYPTQKPKLLAELSWMYFERYRSGEEISDAVDATTTLKEAVDLTPASDHKNLVSHLRSIAIMNKELYQENYDPRYLDEGIPMARRAVEVCEKSEDIEHSFKAITMNILAQMLDSMFEEEDGDCTMMAEAVKYAEQAVELMSEYCNENDGCEHCEDREMFVADREEFRRIYDAECSPLVAVGVE